jgi:hypothetical protein
MASGGAWIPHTTWLESVLPISCRKGAFGVSRKSALPQAARGVCCRKNGWSDQILIPRPAIESPRQTRPDDALNRDQPAHWVALLLRDTKTFS